MKKKKVVVIGLGTFGSEVSKRLTAKGVEVLAIDVDNNKVEIISEEVTYSVNLDATNKKALMSQDIEDYDAVVVAIGDNFDQRIKCVAALNELNIKNLYCRTMSDGETFILNKLGVLNLLSPETEIADIVAEKIKYPSIVSYVNSDGDYLIAEIDVLHDLVGRQIKNIDFRDKYKLVLITVKRSIFESKKDAKYYDMGVITSDVVFNPNDRLVIYGHQTDVERFININN